MNSGFEELCSSLSMVEIIRLQTMLSSSLVRRFERSMALVFSDLAGSTPYFAKFGDEAGRQLQQRHLDLLQLCIAKTEGRIVDTAGDGAFLCFDSADQATTSMIELLRLICIENANRSREHQLAVRIGVHFGRALTDGQQVTGDAVNFCSRVTTSASPGEIRLTRDAFFALTDTKRKLNCRLLPPVQLKGVEQPAELRVLDWRDRAVFPSVVRFESGEEVLLPGHDIISFGRLREKDGLPANDVILECEDELRTLQISRWHFELRRRPEGLVLRAVSNAATAVNETPLMKGQEVLIKAEDRVRVGNVLTLSFEAPHLSAEDSAVNETLLVPMEKSATHSRAARMSAPGWAQDARRSTITLPSEFAAKKQFQ